MEAIIHPVKSKNIIVTNAIGGKYYSAWKKWASSTWIKYCKKNGIGLVIFTSHLIPEDSKQWKKPYWQKLLLGDKIKENFPTVENVCFLDTDILINFTAPNVFDFYNPETIALVSLLNNIPYINNNYKEPPFIKPPRRTLPYYLDLIYRRIAFMRHYYYDKKYPLDSFLFAPIKKIFECENLPPQKDFACTGFFIFNINNHSEMLKEWYHKYNPDIKTLDGGTEQVHLNYELQKWGKLSWLDYRFQALWIYEMAWKYPFLYNYGQKNNKLIQECIEASLFTNYFLHFAGSWEGNMWKRTGILKRDTSLKVFNKFANYENIQLHGMPKGILKPNKDI